MHASFINSSKRKKKITISCQTLEIKYFRQWLQQIRLKTMMKWRGPGPKRLPGASRKSGFTHPINACKTVYAYVYVIHTSWWTVLFSNLAARPSRLLIGSCHPAQVLTICRSRCSPNPTTVPTTRRRAAEGQWRPCQEGTLWCRYANLSPAIKKKKQQPYNITLQKENLPVSSTSLSLRSI